MANVVPVDDFATGEWYPGYKPEHFDMPYIVDPACPFKAGRRERASGSSTSTGRAA